MSRPGDVVQTKHGPHRLIRALDSIPPVWWLAEQDGALYVLNALGDSSWVGAWWRTSFTWREWACAQAGVSPELAELVSAAYEEGDKNEDS